MFQGGGGGRPLLTSSLHGKKVTLYGIVVFFVACPFVNRHELGKSVWNVGLDMESRERECVVILYRTVELVLVTVCVRDSSVAVLDMVDACFFNWIASSLVNNL